MRKIVLTGGGTAGHVTPNLALLPQLQKLGIDVSYIGGITGIEKDLVTKAGIRYYGVPVGKLRRYISFKNFTDAFRVVAGLGESVKLLRKLKPDVVFTKGGFVSVPVVIAARFLRIPVVIHESDITPGLANRIAMPFATAICATFPETMEHLPPNKSVLTGSPIRAELFLGERHKGIEALGFTHDATVLLIMGGSSGSVKINTAIRQNLDTLTRDYGFSVAHICGKGNIDESLRDKPRYSQFEYISDGLNDVLAAASLIVSRAGANSICEFLALKKPHLLIPLSLEASRGDQIANAASFERQGFSAVLQESELDNLLTAIKQTFDNRHTYQNNMAKTHLTDGTRAVLQTIMKNMGTF